MRVAHPVVFVVTALLAVTTVGCGGGDSGDVDAYCALIRSGYGLVSEGESELDAADMEALAAVAPTEIKTAVEELANSAHDLEEIPDEKLAQLFTAAFDPDAQAARQRFDDYAVEVCGLDARDLAAGGVDTDSVIVAEIADYVSASFAADAWTGKVRYEVDRDDSDALTALRVVFVIAPDAGEPVEACQALGVWFHVVHGAAGVVEVIDDDLVVARRADAQSACEAA